MLSKILYVSAEISATSPSSKKIKSFVSSAIAKGSEAAKISSLPIPNKRGDLFLATTRLLLSSMFIAAIAYAPSSFSLALYIAFTIDLVSL